MQLFSFEHWFNEKPDVSKARVWGCPCYAHIVKERQGKAPDKPKAQEGTYLGRSEVDGKSSDGDMVLTRSGEIISSSVTYFSEDWDVKKSPADSAEVQGATAEASIIKGEAVIYQARTSLQNEFPH